MAIGKEASEFKKTYFNSNLEFYKHSGVNPLRIATLLFSPRFIEFIRRKMKEHELLVQRNIWKNFAECKVVVDLGCGEGRFLKSAPSGKEIYGVDINESEVKRLVGEGFRIKRVDIEKEELPYKENFADGVYFSHVIEHLNEPYKALEKIKRILKKRCVLVIGTPNFATYYKRFYDDPTHKSPFTKQGLYRILYDSGFREIEVRNDIYQGSNSLLSLFVLFPRFKFFLERMLGKLRSSYMIAVCRK